MQVRISAVIITLNEAQNIGRCLDSLSGIADEILVVDSFSTDDTEKICLEKGARFLRHPFEGHIQQKNFALSQASSDHVLSLDADEALSPGLQSQILAVKADWRSSAYSFSRLSAYRGKWIRHGHWYPDVKVRLIDRRYARWGGLNPHDALIPDKEIRPVRLPGDLFHFTMNSLEDHIQQEVKFARIAAQTRFAAGKRASIAQLFLNPVWRFFSGYFLKMGFLDGWEGFQIARIAAFGVFLKYAWLRELWSHPTTEKSI